MRYPNTGHPLLSSKNSHPLLINGGEPLCKEFDLNISDMSSSSGSSDNEEYDEGAQGYHHFSQGKVRAALDALIIGCQYQLRHIFPSDALSPTLNVDSSGESQAKEGPPESLESPTIAARINTHDNTEHRAGYT